MPQMKAISLQGLTAYHILSTSGAMREGESVLVHAAAGGVGTLPGSSLEECWTGYLPVTSS